MKAKVGHIEMARTVLFEFVGFLARTTSHKSSKSGRIHFA
jgi:hypothetical protein